MAHICVLSDTHDNKQSSIRAVNQIKELSPELVIHCGDITEPNMLRLFADLPIRFVFGNCDWNKEGLQMEAQALGLSKPDYSQEIAIADWRIFAAHGDNPSALNHAIASQSFDYIFYGHTHIARDEREDRTRVINPGALYRATNYSFVSLNLETDSLVYHQVEKD